MDIIKDTITVTVYLSGVDIHLLQTGVRLRRATTAELQTAATVWTADGAFVTQVNRRTVGRLTGAHVAPSRRGDN